MPSVFLLYANDDLDVVGPLMEALRRENWECQSPHTAGARLQGEADRTEIAESSAVLVVWSSNSADSRRLRAAAEFARGRGTLVQARLDDVGLPFADDVAVDLTQWPEFRYQRAPLTLIDALCEAAGLPPGQYEPTQAPPPRPRGGLRTKDRAVIILGVVLCVTALAMASAVPYINRLTSNGEPQLAAADNSTSAYDGAVTASATSADLLIEWAAVPRTDVAALRRFIVDHPDSALADEARLVIDQLDEAAWADARAHINARDALEALEAYRTTFPTGRYANDASFEELAHRDRVMTAQRFLAISGFRPGPADGVIRRETIAAVEQFERETAREPTGHINESLLTSLASKWPSVAEWITAETGGPRVLSEPPIASGDDSSLVMSPEPRATTPVAAFEPAPPFRDCYVCPEMVALPPGRFDMGDLTGDGDPAERPAHPVEINYGLAIGRFEITFDEWDACASEGSCPALSDDAGWGRGDRPVINVSRTAAQGYADWLQRRTGLPYRLPSEAEWEYAARTGLGDAAPLTSEPARQCRIANAAAAESLEASRNQSCQDGFANQTAPVGSFEADRVGLHDLAGNVAEWVSDCWRANYETAPSDGSAYDENCDSGDGVVRGGSWDSGLIELRASYRKRAADQPSPVIGFRVARPLASLPG